ncbi:MAG: 2-isopropylmalate synthase [bacterium]
MKTVKIFDTTLRDGEQSPGATLNTKEKIQIALQLEKLGIDIMEAGFAISSPDDFNAIQQIAGLIKNVTICSLSRCKKADIDAAWGAIKNAKHPRIHTFLATSKIHLEHKLKLTEDDAIKVAVEHVKYAKKYCEDIEFSPEDAARTESKFLYRILEAVIDVGATTVNIPDTVGYIIPEEFARIIEGIVKNVPNINKAIISVHCHNDLGMATANSLVALKNGAGQIECTVNGLGERAGNAALEEIAMAINTRKDYFDCATNINTKEIMRTSKLVSNLTGIAVQRNKAIVGANAFSHEAGIHQDGILKKRDTYEIMCAEDIGLNSNLLVLGKHSGKHALIDRLEKLGYMLETDEIEKVFERFKKLADQKKEIVDMDLEAIINDEIKISQQKYKLEKINVTCGNQGTPTAFVSLVNDKGEIQETKIEGDGPVDAAYKAIDKIIGATDMQLLEFSMASVTAGIDAQAEVTVKVQRGGKAVVGAGASTDIVIASCKAYLNALNRLI